MRKITCINQNWTFQIDSRKEQKVDLPHTWNAIDGADGGNDYCRSTGIYTRTLARPDFDPGAQRVFLEFDGVNSSAEVYLNDRRIGEHHGGYSTFRFDITEALADVNVLRVEADNRRNDTVYPQKADFTFYGGIYRDVKLLVVSRDHFELEDYGAPGLRITSTPQGEDAKVRVESFVCLAQVQKLSDYQVSVELTDQNGQTVASCCEPLRPYETIGVSNISEAAMVPQANARADMTLTIRKVHRWEGRQDPICTGQNAHFCAAASRPMRWRAALGCGSFRWTRTRASS